MTATELIKELERVIAQVGDQTVLWLDDQECHDQVCSVTGDEVNKCILLR
jgi:hypothetical protein